MILRYEAKEDTKVLFGVRYMEAPGDADPSISRFVSQWPRSEVMQAIYADGSVDKFSYVRGVHR